MQNRKLRKLIAVILGIFIFSSCTSDYIIPEPAVVPEPPAPGEISYSGAIQPIFTAKCVRCHGQGQTPPNLSVGKSYNSLMNMESMVVSGNPENSILYQKMNTGGSMAQFCTTSNADSVYKWIQQGAKNN